MLAWPGRLDEPALADLAGHGQHDRHLGHLRRPLSALGIE
jgi:hypothetical protein